MDSVFRRQIRRITGDGATVLLSSHVLSEVEQLCNRITIIRSGTAVETGTLTELRHLTRTRFRITAATQPAALAALPGVHDLRSDGTGTEFNADASDLGSVLEGLAAAGVTTITATPPSLEELFLRHYSGRNGQVR